MLKITVLGDVMCEPPVLKAARQKDGSYCFDEVFEKVSPMLHEADFSIANLEFPMAGEAAEYTKSFFVFNAPDAYAVAAKNAGIDLVSTVNNHTLDRGVDGMLRTMRVLDEIGLARVGTFLPDEPHSEAYYFERGGVTFAVVAYTYVTNKKLPVGDPHLFCMNLLRDPRAETYTPEVKAKLKTWVDKLFRKLKEEKRAWIKRRLGMPGTIARADDAMDMARIEPYIQQFTEDIRKAKQKADVVICYPHVGGQFNILPGKFSEYVVQEAVKAGADAVLASHSHMVQRATFEGDVPLAYSIGNFSMTPRSDIIVHEHLPEYGLAMHLYVDGKKIERVTFSILKAVAKRGKQLVSYPVDELYATLKSERAKRRLERDVRQVLSWVIGNVPDGELIQREYELTK